MLFTPFMLQSNLLKHMGPVDLPKSKKLKQTKITTDPIQLPNLYGIVKLIKQLTEYHRLRLSACWIMTHKIIPRRCRNKRTNRLLDLADKGAKRIDQALDVRAIVESQEDLIYFMQQFMGKRQMWLFRHERQRFLSLDRSLPLDWYENLKNKDQIFKLGGMKTGYLETKLLRGIKRATL